MVIGSRTTLSLYVHFEACLAAVSLIESCSSTPSPATKLVIGAYHNAVHSLYSVVKLLLAHSPFRVQVISFPQSPSLSMLRGRSSCPLDQISLQPRSAPGISLTNRHSSPSPLAVLDSFGKDFFDHSSLAFCIRSSLCLYSACACAALPCDVIDRWCWKP